MTTIANAGPDRSSEAGPQSDTTQRSGISVDELCRLLAGRSDEIEAARRLPDDVAASLRKTGIFRQWLPRELGGNEAEPGTVIDDIQALSAADGSVGWCAAIGLGSNLIGGYLPEHGAREVYATGHEVAAGSLMPAGTATRNAGGDLIVDGRWPFASGAHHSDWLVGAVIIPGSRPAEVRLVVMPRTDVELLDTWQVLGLKGTGSTDFEAHGLVVPERHSALLTDLHPWPAGPMWRIPLHSLLLPVMAAVPLGIARAALVELSRLAVAKTPSHGSRTLAERDSTRSAVAIATATVDSAAGYLTSTMTALLAASRAGRVPTPMQRAAARLAAVHAAQGAAAVVETAYRTAGSSAMRLTSPLQRHLRDVNTATQHYALSHNGYETVGRVLLGFEPDGPL